MVAAAFSVILRLCVVLLFCFWAGLLDIVNRIGLAASKLRHSHSSADFLRFGAGDFRLKIPFSTVLQNLLFLALALRSGFGAAISDVVARSSCVFWNSVSADRIVMGESRLLGAAVSYVFLVISLACCPESTPVTCFCQSMES